MPPEGWRDADAAAGWARRLLWLYAALSAAAAALAILRGLRPPSASPIELAVALLQMAAFVAAAASFLRWLYLARANLQALGAEGLMASPGWSVAWFLIPFANLLMPLLAVRETWRASADPGAWQDVTPPAILLLWWTAWLGAFFAAIIALRLAFDYGAERGATAQALFLAADLLSIVAALLLARVVAAIQLMQLRAVQPLIRHRFQ